MTFGSRLTIIRKEHKIFQSELAQKAGIHFKVLRRYERGEANSTLELSTNIADVFRISLDYLVGKTDVELGQAILNKEITIQKLPEENNKHILYSLDELILFAKTRLAYK